MKQLAISLTVLIVLAAGGRATSQTVDTAHELHDLEQQRSDAIRRGDRAVLERIYADDFKGIVGSGQTIGKAELLEVFRRNDPSVEFSTTEIDVRVFADVAVFTGRLTGVTADHRVLSDARFTHVFVRREGRWLCVAGQSTAVAKP